MRCNKHYHVIDLPNGRKIRTRKDCNLGDDEELGFSLGKFLKSAVKVVGGAGLGTLLGGPMGGQIGALVGSGKKGKKLLSIGAKIGAPLAGAAFGTMLGPGVGTAIGGKLGGVVGNIAGKMLDSKGRPITVKSQLQFQAQAGGVSEPQETITEQPSPRSVVSSKKRKTTQSIPQGMTPAELPESTTPAVTADDIKQQVLAAVAQTNPVTREDILQQVIAAIDQTNNVTRANEDTAKEIASHVTPSLEHIISTLAENKLQQVATSEHKKIVKDDSRWRANKQGQKNILAKIASLEAKISAKQRANATVSAAFGIPDKHL